VNVVDILTPFELGAKKCQPCEGGVEPCELGHAKRQLHALGTEWELVDGGKKLSRKFKLKNFVEAMRLLNAVAEIAEQEQHHPDLHLTGYRQVRIDLTTHAINGLSENDFILAAKIDVAVKQLG
jgi:4a-hydroxytetrahydrobiopterin dehydratase